MSRRKVLRELDLPIIEASGLCSFEGSDDSTWVALISDADNSLAMAAMAGGGELDWLTLNLGEFEDVPSDLRQLEAIESAGGTRFVVMAEEPALLALGDFAARQFLGEWHLSAGNDAKFAEIWSSGDNSRGEAMVLGPNGHLLVIKEKKPVVVVEFGPAGDQPLMTDPSTWGVTPWEPAANGDLVALAWTVLEGPLADVSDAAVSGNQIWLLSDEEQAVAPLRLQNGKWDIGKLIKLDKMVDKPEGLTRLPNGEWWMCMDRDDLAANLMRIESLDD